MALLCTYCKKPIPKEMIDPDGRPTLRMGRGGFCSEDCRDGHAFVRFGAVKKAEPETNPEPKPEKTEPKPVEKKKPPILKPISFSGAGMIYNLLDNMVILRTPGSNMECRIEKRFLKAVVEELAYIADLEE